jgi:hypothetical protein
MYAAFQGTLPIASISYGVALDPPDRVSLIVAAERLQHRQVAKMLDEDEAWLERLAMEMGPEDGGLSLRPPPHSKAASIGRRKPSANRLV